MKVAGAKATDSSHTTFKFPCDAVLPDLFLNFATGGTVGLSGYSMTFNNPDADNSEFPLYHIILTPYSSHASPLSSPRANTIVEKILT